MCGGGSGNGCDGRVTVGVVMRHTTLILSIFLYSYADKMYVVITCYKFYFKFKYGGKPRLLSMRVAIYMHA